MEFTIMLFKANTYGMWEVYLDILEQNGFVVTKQKVLELTEKFLKKWYQHIADKSFFPEIVEFNMSRPTLALIVEGKDVVSRMREFMGPTDPKDANPGQLRYGMKDKTANGFHASDSTDSAQHEKKLIEEFFGQF